MARTPAGKATDPDRWKPERPMGLARALMKAGFGTRRQIEELVLAGRIAVDGEVVTDPLARIDGDSDLLLDNRPLTKIKHSYYAFHKPARVVCSQNDSPGSKLVADFFPKEVVGLKPVGRMDVRTTGLILVSNDHEWGRTVVGSGNLDQEFRIQVDGELTELEISVVTAGVLLPNFGLFRPRSVQVVEIMNGYTVLNLVVGEGKLRQVRRMLTSLRYKVVFVRRIRIGQIRLGDLAVGRFRHLTSGEIAAAKVVASGLSGSGEGKY